MIGDTMERMNMIDFSLSSMSQDYKRNFFYQLDKQLKQIHEAGGVVRNFSPQTITIDEETRVPSFPVVYPSSKLFYDQEDAQDAKLSDIRMLAILAFCTYLAGDSGEYHLEDGLLQFDVLANNLDFMKEYFPEEDWDYYQTIFSSSVPMTGSLYYSDYIDEKMKGVGRGMSSSSKKLVNSTPAGRAMAKKDSEAAYVNYILSFVIVGISLLLSVFLFFQLKDLFL